MSKEAAKNLGFKNYLFASAFSSEALQILNVSKNCDHPPHPRVLVVVEYSWCSHLVHTPMVKYRCGIGKSVYHRMSSSPSQ